jgi:hypothetical protein
MRLDAKCGCGSEIHVEGGDGKYPYANEARLKELFVAWKTDHQACATVREKSEQRYRQGLQAAHDAIAPLGAGDFARANDYDAGQMRGIESACIAIQGLIEAPRRMDDGSITPLVGHALN